MSNSKIYLTYCSENRDVVEHFATDLGRVGIKFVHDTRNAAKRSSLESEMASDDTPIYLFVSDNFLKSVDCMEGALKFIDNFKFRPRIKPIVIDGRQRNAETGIFEDVPTKFDKVSNVIRYMNYWQDEYLRLRREKRSIPSSEEASFQIKIDRIRRISNEIGEFLRSLRGFNYFEFETLKHNDCKNVFDMLGFEGSALYNRYKTLPELPFRHSRIIEPIEVAAPEPIEEEPAPSEEPKFKIDGIPGLDLLPEYDNKQEEIIDDAPVEIGNKVDEAAEIFKKIENEQANEPDVEGGEEEEEVEAGTPDDESGAAPKDEEASPSDSYQTAEEFVQDLTNELEVEAPAPELEVEAPALELEVEAPALELEVEAPALELEVEAPAPELEVEAPALELEVEAPALELEVEAPAPELEVEAPALELEVEAPALELEVEAPALELEVEAPALELEVEAPAPELEVEAPAPELEVEAPALELEVEAPAPELEVEAPAPELKVEAPAPELEVEAPALELEVEAPAPELEVEAPAPELEVEAPAPELEVEAPAPELKVEAPAPELEVEAPAPELEVEAPAPELEVEAPAPELEVEAPAPELEVEEDVAIVIRTPAMILAATQQLVAEGKFGAAKENYQLLLTKSDDAKIRLGYATLLQDNLNDDTSAKEHLEELLLQDKANNEVYFRLGTLAENAGEFLAAKNYYERVISMDSNYADAYHRLGLIVSTRFENQKFVAKSYYQEAINVNPENATYHLDFATFLTKQGEYKKARKQLIEVIDLDEENANAHMALATLYLHHLDKQKKARKYYEKAISIDGDLRTDASNVKFGLAPAVTEEAAFAQARGVQPLAPKPEALTVMVTGATSGIGLAIAETYMEAGHKVIMTGRREERLRAMQLQFTKKYGIEPQVLAFDVRDNAQMNEVFNALPEEWKEIDILVNNAGLAKGFSPIHEGSLEHWETMIDTNFKGLLYVTRMISPIMVNRQKGHIINIGSSAGKEVYPNGNVYCATKFAVDALTRGMRLDLHPYNIRVTNVNPGHVETEFALVRFDGDPERAKIYEDFKPLTAKDVAAAVMYATAQPEHVNVQDIDLFATQQASNYKIDRSGR